MMTFAPIDLLFLIIIFLFAVIAAAKGLVDEFFGKASFFAGLIMAVFFYAKLTPYLQKYITNHILASVTAFILIFVVVYLIIKIIQQIVRRAFSGQIMKGLDRSLGFLFGIVEGLAVVVIIIIVLISQPWFDIGKLLDGSFFYRMLGGLVSSSGKLIRGAGGINPPSVPPSDSSAALPDFNGYIV